jgi:hypothetical protein
MNWLKAHGQGHIRVHDRHSVSVTDGQTVVRWHVPASTGLFRGSRMPPLDMDRYPADYVSHLSIVVKVSGALNREKLVSELPLRFRLARLVISSGR